MSYKQLFIRNIDYKIVIEEFIVSSMLAILGIRFFLKITNYPHIGGERFHISHMLWGGLLMFVALMLLLTLMNNEVKRIAGIIGGLGFGTFIDELGKFITRDNNYFYKPTFALIYVFFVLFYLLLQFIQTRHEFTDQEYLVNSIDLMKEAAINDLDTKEKDRMVEYISKSKSDTQLTKSLIKLISEIQATKNDGPHIVTKIKNYFKNIYYATISLPWFKNVLITFFLIEGFWSLIVTILLIVERNTLSLPSFLLPHSFTTSSFNLIQLFSTFLSVIFILIGISRIYVSRLSAYLMFKRSLLVSILLTQVFVFYYSPVRAFTTLSFNILVLVTLNYFINTESELQLKKKS